MEDQDFEKKIGIDTFLNNGNIILGVFKYRVSDFIVNEVQINTKNVIYFEADPVQEVTKAVPKQNQQGALPTIQHEDIPQLREFFKDQADDILKFYSDLENGDKKSEFFISIKCPELKEERIKIHTFVREKMPCFDSNTEEKVLKIFFCKNNSKRQKRQQSHPHLTYSVIMMKSGIDTLNACYKLSTYLQIHNRFITSAGIKDKRGITTQEITFKHRQDFPNLQKRLQFAKFNDTIKFCKLQLAQQMLMTGDLYGNRFSIAIRLIQFNEEDIKQNIINLKNDGYINYFGTQRFGVSSLIKTHEIGCFILQKKYKEAFDAIISIEEQQMFYDDLEKYKKSYDSSKILRILPKKFKVTRAIIEGLSKQKNLNFKEALLSVNRNLRSLYIHAFQSYLWNRLASTRIALYGKSLVKGDIVATDRKLLQEAFNILGEDENNLQAEEIETDQQQQGEDFDDQEEQQETQKMQKKYQGINQIPIEVIDDHNIQNYSIKDVLIPIYGDQIKLPDQFNLKQKMEEIFTEHSLNLDSFQGLTHNYQASGGFRFLLQQVEDLEYSMIKFDDKKEDILTPFYLTEKDKNSEKGVYNALVLRFSLQKGSYATMAMREVTKTSSSIEFQRTLNDQFDSI